MLQIFLICTDLTPIRPQSVRQDSSNSSHQKRSEREPIAITVCIQKTITPVLGLACTWATAPAAADVIKVAMIDALTGTFAAIGKRKTGYGWRVDQKIDASVGALPTTCALQRPAQDLAQVK